MQSSPSAAPPSPSLSRPSWSPPIISLIGTFCTIFLVLSYYGILRKHCLYRIRSQRRLLTEDNNEVPSSQYQSRALDSTILEALPTVQFVEDEEAGRDCGTDCAVCLGEFEKGEWLRVLPGCSHVFHAACVDTWFQSHSSCPLCRLNVNIDLMSPREGSSVRSN